MLLPNPPINLFGTSDAALQGQRLIVANVPQSPIVSQHISVADDYISYDRSAGNVQVIMPTIAEVIDGISKSGNKLNPTFVFADVTNNVSASTFTLLLQAGENICNDDRISRAGYINQTAGNRFALKATPTGWLMVVCPAMG